MDSVLTSSANTLYDSNDFKCRWVWGASHFLWPIRFLLKLRSMIEHSRQWALARGLVEKSAVHGEEEWRIPLKRRFANTEKTGSEVSERVTQQVEERSLIA